MTEPTHYMRQKLRKAQKLLAMAKHIHNDTDWRAMLIAEAVHELALLHHEMQAKGYLK